jgi:GAF domain-containing protein
VAASSPTLGGEGPRTPAYSDGLALDLDLVQYRLGAGPCLQAAQVGRPVLVDDARADDRWPGYLSAAVARGSLSSLSVPLQVGDDSVGGLNLYAATVGAFADPAVRQTADQVAGSAAAGLATVQTLAQATATADHLQTAMVSRAPIEQAKGILMERYRVTEDAAFARLRAVSQATNRKLRDVADHLVTTGELPRLNRAGTAGTPSGW